MLNCSALTSVGGWVVCVGGCKVHYSHYMNVYIYTYIYMCLYWGVAFTAALPWATQLKMNEISRYVRPQSKWIEWAVNEWSWLNMLPICWDRGRERWEGGGRGCVRCGEWNYYNIKPNQKFGFGCPANARDLYAGQKHLGISFVFEPRLEEITIKLNDSQKLRKLGLVSPAVTLSLSLCLPLSLWSSRSVAVCPTAFGIGCFAF